MEQAAHQYVLGEQFAAAEGVGIELQSDAGWQHLGNVRQAEFSLTV